MEFPLADDHSELDALLEETFAALDEENVETIYKSLDFFWARLAMHIRAEHLHLFPAILDSIEKQGIVVKTNGFPALVKARAMINNLQGDHNFFMRELLAIIKLLREWRENEVIEDFSDQLASMC